METGMNDEVDIDRSDLSCLHIGMKRAPDRIDLPLQHTLGFSSASDP